MALARGDRGRELRIRHDREHEPQGKLLGQCASFFNSLKNERVFHEDYATREEARQDLLITLRCFITGNAATPRYITRARPSIMRLGSRSKNWRLDEPVGIRKTPPSSSH